MAVLNSQKLQKIFSESVLLKIGSVSLYVYMLHWSLLLSMVPALIMLFPWEGNYSVVIFSCCLMFAVALGIMSAMLSAFDRKVIAGWLKRL